MSFKCYGCFAEFSTRQNRDLHRNLCKLEQKRLSDRGLVQRECEIAGIVQLLVLGDQRRLADILFDLGARA